jgi:hypothetical protein
VRLAEVAQRLIERAGLRGRMAVAVSAAAVDEPLDERPASDDELLACTVEPHLRATPRLPIDRSWIEAGLAVLVDASLASDAALLDALAALVPGYRPQPEALDVDPFASPVVVASLAGDEEAPPESSDDEAAPSLIAVADGTAGVASR